MSFQRTRNLFIPAALLTITLSGCGVANHNNQPQRATPVRTSAQVNRPVDNVQRELPPPLPESRVAAPRQAVPVPSGAPARQRQRPQQIEQPEVAIPANQVEARNPVELATHETSFNVKEKDRNSNIERAAKTINGHIVQPGEVFSYKETVGPTNEKRGYKKGTIFVKGEKVEGVGGGVCQVSTTLYNAAANAGMTILERHDHSRPVTYAEEGEDAAISYGGIDFKFKNDKPFPVRINANAAKEQGTISVTISAI